jgi:uncharacterized protein
VHLVGSLDDLPPPVESLKDAPLLEGSLSVRLMALFTGLVVIAIAIVCMLESELGLPPWDVFHMGVSEHTPLSLGTASIVVGLAILVVAWIAGAPPGFGTFANAIVIGLTIDLLVRVPAVDALSTASLPVRMLLVVAGVWLFGVGSAFYIGAGLGAGPRDSLMLALSRRSGWRIGLVRGGIEVTALIAGLLLGGVAGIGTIALALVVGPSLELAFWLLMKMGMASPGPRHAPEFGPLDVG